MEFLKNFRSNFTVTSIVLSVFSIASWAQDNSQLPELQNMRRVVINPLNLSNYPGIDYQIPPGYGIPQGYGLPYGGYGPAYRIGAPIQTQLPYGGFRLPFESPQDGNSNNDTGEVAQDASRQDPSLLFSSQSSKKGRSFEVGLHAQDEFRFKVQLEDYATIDTTQTLSKLTRQRALIDVLDADERVIYSDWVEEGKEISYKDFSRVPTLPAKLTVKVRKVDFEIPKELNPDPVLLHKIENASVTFNLEVQTDSRQESSFYNPAAVFALLCEEETALADVLAEAEYLVDIYRDLLKNPDLKSAQCESYKYQMKRRMRVAQRLSRDIEQELDNVRLQQDNVHATSKINAK